MTDRHDEHYESIPWDSLVTDDARRRRRWIYLGVGVIVALAVGGAIGRSLAGGRSAGTAVAGPESTTTTTTAATTTTTEAAPVTRSAGDMTVAAYAEWFVADYFTVDGSEVTRQAIIDRLPAGVELPAIDGTERSFVESAFATSVEHTGGDQYRVVVVVRALAAFDGTAYQRQPARAVAVPIALTVDGPAVLDLPRPAALDVVPALAFEVEPDDAPDAVLSAAQDEAMLWGTPVGDPVAGRVGELWRVVQVVEDGQGLSWPIASWFDDSGHSTDPPG